MFYTIVGTQWGDEGKGKIVDWISSKADLIVRYQGGNNAVSYTHLTLPTNREV